MFFYFSPANRVSAQQPLRAIKAGLCEQLITTYCTAGFWDMSLDEGESDQSHFSRLRAQLVASQVARRSFKAVLAQVKAEGLAAHRRRRASSSYNRPKQTTWIPSPKLSTKPG